MDTTDVIIATIAALNDHLDLAGVCKEERMTAHKMKENKIMKLQATKKEITEQHVHVIRVGYCDLYALLQQEQPQAYTAGVYGWNADVYSYGNAAISTGYRSFGDIKPPYDLIKEYEDKAKKINLSTYDWAERKKLKKALIEKFILAAI